MRFRITAACIAVTLAGVGSASWVGAAVQRRSGPRPITKSVHVAFEGCSAKTTVLGGAMSGSIFRAGQAVSVLVVVKNESGAACGSGLQDNPPLPAASDRLVVGLCGQMSLTVRTVNGAKNGRLVFPGPILINCPNIPYLVIAAHGSLGTAATWNQMIYPAGQRSVYASETAPAGRYVLSIDGKLSFPITLVR